jgi:hypothetical protein
VDSGLADPEQRAVVVLRRSPFRYHEIAAALGCPIGTVIRLHYAALRPTSRPPEVSDEMRRRTTVLNVVDGELAGGAIRCGAPAALRSLSRERAPLRVSAVTPACRLIRRRA